MTLSASASSFNENGGQVTVTATLTSPAATTTTIDLGYTGSAVANIDYSISNTGTPRATVRCRSSFQPVR